VRQMWLDASRGMAVAGAGRSITIGASGARMQRCELL
jgi:hypothetical protein